MKKLLTLVFALVMASVTVADNFQVIERIIGPRIKYGKKFLNVGDTIEGKAKVALDHYNTIFVLNLDRDHKKFQIKGDTYNKKKCKNFSDYFSSNVPKISYARKDYMDMGNMAMFGGVGALMGTMGSIGNAAAADENDPPVKKRRIARFLKDDLLTDNVFYWTDSLDLPFYSPNARPTFLSQMRQKEDSVVLVPDSYYFKLDIIEEGSLKILREVSLPIDRKNYTVSFPKEIIFGDEEPKPLLVRVRTNFYLYGVGSRDKDNDELISLPFYLEPIK